MNIVEVRNLNKKYPSFALQDVSFGIEPGRIVGFIGRNGAGKTTTIKSMLNLVHPDSGEVLYFGKSLRENEAEIKKHFRVSTGAVQMLFGCGHLIQRKLVKVHLAKDSGTKHYLWANFTKLKRESRMEATMSVMRLSRKNLMSDLLPILTFPLYLSHLLRLRHHLIRQRSEQSHRERR